MKTTVVALTKMDLAPDPPVEKSPCNDCGLCVSSCPAGALNVAGKTDVMEMPPKQPTVRNGCQYRLLVPFWCRYK